MEAIKEVQIWITEEPMRPVISGTEWQDKSNENNYVFWKQFVSKS